VNDHREDAEEQERSQERPLVAARPDEEAAPRQVSPERLEPDGQGAPRVG
jgi:hypothetical protein